VNTGDIILIGLRDYQDAKADVILKYSSDEARNLKAYGELPESGQCTCTLFQICLLPASVHETLGFTEVVHSEADLRFRSIIINQLVLFTLRKMRLLFTD